jgi:hypothetical protein
MFKKNRIETLRLTPREHEAIMRALEEREASDDRRQQRRSERLSYHCPDGLVVRLHQPGRDPMDYLVRPRNLSEGGLGFLHGGFVYPGSIFIVSLVSLDGLKVTVPGKVVRSSCVFGRIHDVGVSFDSAISIEDFVISRDGLEAGMPEVMGDAEYDVETLLPLARRLVQLIEVAAPINDVRVAWVAIGRLIQPSKKEPAATP